MITGDKILTAGKSPCEIRANQAKPKPAQIMDETEQTRTIVVKQRSYTVPKDVADSYEQMRKALRKIHEQVFYRFGIPGQQIAKLAENALKETR